MTKPLEEMTYEELNNHTYNNFMKKYYYDDWASKNPKLGVEIIFSPKCNLKCEYCYMKKYSHKTYPDALFETTNSIKNTIDFLAWLGKHDYNPSIEIFSGELFAQKAGYELLEAMIEFYNSTAFRKPKEILIPTNGTFLLSETYTDKIESYIRELDTLGIKLILSLSIDGLLLEDTSRSYKKALDLDENINLPRNQEYYDKLFTFIQKHNFAIHPMIAPENIDKWKENFLWIQEMYDKYGFDWNDLYLLEVRNYNWTTSRVNKFCDFIKFLLDYAWEKTNKNKEAFLDWLIKINREDEEYYINGFNTLINPFVKSTNFGARCGQQSFLMLRPADFKVFFCHRIMYPETEIGEYIKNGEEFEFKVKQAELGLTINSFLPENLPVCNTCAIRSICPTQCLGSCMEATGEMFSPIPSVCNLFFAKNITILSKLEEFGCLIDFINYLEPDARATCWKLYNEEIKKEKK